MATEPGPYAGSRAILIGVSAYEDPQFPPIRAARNSLAGMRRVLAEPSLCGWPPETITTISNPESAADLAVQITNLARATRGVLLIYYVGHGTLTERGELCLSVTATRADHPNITGVPWTLIAEAMRQSPAGMRIAILDCCFAGQAIEALASETGAAMADVTHIKGVYTLTATTRNRTAHVPPPDWQESASTSFTGALIDLITSGVPGGPPDLTLGMIYPHLRAELSARGLPLPNQRNTDLADHFVFARNRAALPQAVGAPPRVIPVLGTPTAKTPVAEPPRPVPRPEQLSPQALVTVPKQVQPPKQRAAPQQAVPPRATAEVRSSKRRRADWRNRMIVIAGAFGTSYSIMPWLTTNPSSVYPTFGPTTTGDAWTYGALAWWPVLMMAGIAVLVGCKEAGLFQAGARTIASAAVVSGGAGAIGLAIQAYTDSAEANYYLQRLGYTSPNSTIGFGVYFGILCSSAICGFGYLALKSARKTAGHDRLAAQRGQPSSWR
jgi:Caspase domain